MRNKALQELDYQRARIEAPRKDSSSALADAINANDECGTIRDPNVAAESERDSVRPEQCSA